jgi:uncharacterized cupredoxin-like copper-binding protein
MKLVLRTLMATLLLGSATIVAAPGLLHPTQAHEGEFSAGKAGNPKKPARVIRVSMREGDGKMLFAPDRIEVHKGEQIRFVIHNDGVLDHEFVLASVADNDKHTEMMKKNPDMDHDDPNAVSAKPSETVELLLIGPHRVVQVEC